MKETWECIHMGGNQRYSKEVIRHTSKSSLEIICWETGGRSSTSQEDRYFPLLVKLIPSQKPVLHCWCKSIQIITMRKKKKKKKWAMSQFSLLWARVSLALFFPKRFQLWAWCCLYEVTALADVSKVSTKSSSSVSFFTHHV